MADDWAPGDLAVCVRGESPVRGSAGDMPTLFMVGGIYHVIDVIVWDVTALVIENHPNRHPTNAWRADCFRKVPPHEADEFDREVIALLNGTPVPVEV